MHWEGKQLDFSNELNSEGHFREVYMKEATNKQFEIDADFEKSLRINVLSFSATL